MLLFNFMKFILFNENITIINVDHSILSGDRVYRGIICKCVTLFFIPFDFLNVKHA